MPTGRKRRKQVPPDDELQLLDRALDLYLESCYSRPRTPRAEVSEFAATLGLSRQYVNRRFSVLCGESALSRMRARQIEHAQMLLVTTDLSAEQVGVASAFGSPATFSRLFRERTGTTPGEFRKEARKRQSEWP